MKATILGVALALLVGACASEDPNGPNESRELPIAETTGVADSDVPATAVAPVPAVSVPSGAVWKTMPAERVPPQPKPDPPGPHW